MIAMMTGMIGVIASIDKQQCCFVLCSNVAVFISLQACM